MSPRESSGMSEFRQSDFCTTRSRKCTAEMRRACLSRAAGSAARAASGSFRPKLAREFCAHHRPPQGEPLHRFLPEHAALTLDARGKDLYGVGDPLAVDALKQRLARLLFAPPPGSCDFPRNSFPAAPARTCAGRIPDSRLSIGRSRGTRQSCSSRRYCGPDRRRCPQRRIAPRSPGRRSAPTRSTRT